MHLNRWSYVRCWRHAAVLIGALGAAAASVDGAPAQDAYPSRPVKIVVGMPAGSFTDLSARLIGDSLRAEHRLSTPSWVD
jgi:tripartite-type tricarboxylate transporter receptor subunit TctC